MPDPPVHVAEHPQGPGVTRRLLNSLAGRVLVDGKIAASWGRAAGDVTIAPWVRLTRRQVDRITAEVEAFATVLGRPIRLRRLT